MGSDDIRALLNEEASAGEPQEGSWHAEYLGRSYRSAVELALARVDGGARVVLKTDLWNECLGGVRDIAGHFHEACGCCFYGVDLAYEVCAEARSRVPAAHVVQADIRSLPFRSGSFDAVLDLSTLDHLPDDGVGEAIDEYRRVLRARGVLLLLFWQRSFVVRQRLLLKRLLGRREKGDQQYFARAAVRAKCREALVVVKEFVTGTLLIPPYGVTGWVLGRVPARLLARFLRWQVKLERSAALKPLLKHVAGLYGITAVRGERGMEDVG
jgi:SAM-dependent methyltransferase